MAPSPLESGGENGPLKPGRTITLTPVPSSPFRKRKSPSKSGRISPKKKEKTPSPKKEEEVKGKGEEEEEECIFPEHAELCGRMKKNFYFANKLPSTPRPSLPLTRLAVSTFTKKARQDTLAYLDLEQAAEIGRNACVTPTALIMALVYLERLSVHNPGYLGSIKPSELFVVSLLAASKFMQDDGEDLGIFNDEWATSAHMELKELNKMEVEFLMAIDWNLKVGPEEYNRTLAMVEKEISVTEGKSRGWFTCTEIANLLSFQAIWPTICEHYLKVVTAACITYTTLIATLLTTTILGPQIFMLSKSYLATTSLLRTDSTTAFSYCANNNSNCNATTKGMHPGSGNATDESSELDVLPDEEELLTNFQALLRLREPSLDVENRTSNIRTTTTLSNDGFGVRWSRPGNNHHLPHHGTILDSVFSKAVVQLINKDKSLTSSEKCYAPNLVRAAEKDNSWMGSCTTIAYQKNFGVSLPFRKNMVPV